MNKLAQVICNVIELKGMNIFDNASMFIGIIDDLAPELTRERNICHRVIDSEILNLLKGVEMVDVSQRYKAVARCRYYICEEKGINEEWYGIIISAFDQALGWNIVVKKVNDNKTMSIHEKEKLEATNVTRQECSVIIKDKTKDMDENTDNLIQARERISITQGKAVGTGAYTVALKNDGTVVTTGNNKYGQCNTMDWNNIVAVSVDGGWWYHTVGLKADGTVVAVGNNEFGQIDVSHWKDIVAINASNGHTIGLKKDGTLLAVGHNEYGECDIDEWKNIISISSNYHTVGLKSNGTVVAIGNNKEGQCNVSNWTDIVSICVGKNHTLGLKADGTVVAAGSNKLKQCKVEEWKDVIAICAGPNCSMGIKVDGTVVATGYNSFGQLNVSTWKDIIAVCAGEAHSIGLKSDGTLVSVGRNDNRQCDVNEWNLFENIE